MLKRLDYRDFKIVPIVGAQGADIVASKSHKRYAIKCKRHFTAVGVDTVEEVYSAQKYYKCDAAIIMTNSTFTNDAIELARQLGINLVDRDAL